MRPPKRSRITPTDDWPQLRLLLDWPEQITYEIGLSMLAWVHRNRRRQREGLTMYRMQWDVIAPAIHQELVAMSGSP